MKCRTCQMPLSQFTGWVKHPGYGFTCNDKTLQCYPPSARARAEEEAAIMAAEDPEPVRKRESKPRIGKNAKRWGDDTAG